MDKKKSSGSGLYRLLLKLTKKTMYILFRSDMETLKDVPEPYLLLSNHTTDFDCAFIAAASQAPVSFVATENILRMGLLGNLAAKLFHPIIHYKGTMGITTSKHIIKAMRDGKNVAMFPEGNRSFNGTTCPIPPGHGEARPHELRNACDIQAGRRLSEFAPMGFHAAEGTDQRSGRRRLYAGNAESDDCRGDTGRH